MALTNYERQKRWRERNRVVYNLRRRNARKGLKANPEYARASHEVEIHGPEHPRTTIEELRLLVKQEESRKPEERATMPVMKPKMFFNDHGAVISEKLWNELQERKRVAREKGYEFDPQ